MRRYRALARVPHGPLLLTAAATFYPAQAGLGIAVLLALHHATGSFATAGAAGAAETICFSLSSLAQGRLLDRRDPRVLIGLAGAFMIAIVAMTIALSTGASAIVLIGLTAAIGATMPGTGAAQRAVWSSLLSERISARPRLPISRSRRTRASCSDQPCWARSRRPSHRSWRWDAVAR